MGNKKVVNGGFVLEMQKLVYSKEKDPIEFLLNILKNVLFKIFKAFWRGGEGYV
ncbi:hypothetical protein AA106555_0133 [Neokomagataea thailandica NBRC 106555]|uniref:Uncharacterized protein n=1 Tax=Neokomagataea thailandica NBRC 106555 TaxID=1223520 RepID=A0ABQ0QM85_9PROT|nr:hypothetical protein AA106555_0133 [Neokomagataea thailandica NBRC 106555]